LTGGQSPFLLLVPDAITFELISFYDDVFSRVFIGHREKKLNLLSKFHENIDPFGLFSSSGHYAAGNTLSVSSLRSQPVESL